MINDFRGKYRWLSNFWSCFIIVQGEAYPSVENAYQALKMENISDREKFKYIKASEAKQLGKILPMRDDWEQYFYDSRWCNKGEKIQHKISLMHYLVQQKFEQNEFLKKLLLETNDEHLEEGNWWGDTFWGTVNGEGENWLGKILMKVRADLRAIN